MQQFFISENQIENGSVYITGSDVNHIRNVLRMKKGEKLRACVPGEKAWICQIEEISQETVTAKILDFDGTYAELPSQIILFQGLPKGDKMELIIQKAVELGAAQIVPTAMANCVVKLNAQRAQKKKLRYQAVALSAAEQSKRGIIPLVTDVMTFAQAADYAAGCDTILVPYEMADADSMAATKEAIESIRSGMSVGIFIGPEGGFDPKEIAYLREKYPQRTKIISLGHRILRTETAGLTMLSVLMYHFEVAAASEALHSGSCGGEGYGMLSGSVGDDAHR